MLVIYDPLPKLMHEVATDIGTPTAIPPWLDDIERCLGLILKVEEVCVPEIHKRWSQDEAILKTVCDQELDKLASTMKILGVTSHEDKKNILARLWSGCTFTTKAIAAGTRSGENTPDTRKRGFEEEVNPRAESDPIFRSGSIAGAWLKRRRNEPIFKAGIPSGSAVLTRWPQH